MTSRFMYQSETCLDLDEYYMFMTVTTPLPHLYALYVYSVITKTKCTFLGNR